MPCAIDMTGKRFSRLVVVEFVGRQGDKRQWRCICDCGNIVYATTTDLRSKHTTSCGCARLERISVLNRSHGQSKSQIYEAYRSMMSRCGNSGNKDYAYYGARGITVCSEWGTFEGFFADMGYPPTGCELDRIDNDKGYSKDNCRWTTHTKNCRNRRSNRLLTYRGETRPLSEWAERLRINYATLATRLNSMKMSVERAFEIPVSTENRRGIRV